MVNNLALRTPSAAADTPHSALRTPHSAFIMLATCFMLLLSLTGAWGQSNSEYNFRQQSVVDGDRYSDDDDAPILSMDGLAANGSGQWTISSLTGNRPSGMGTQYVPGWYLLANGLYKPSIKYDASNPTDYPGCIPPGVVQNGTTIGAIIPSEAEAVANLNGAVDYVWPDALGQNFVVNEFTSSDVDISLSFLSNPHPPMNVVTAPAIHTYTIPTSTTCGCITPPCTHDVWRVTPYQDEFQVAADARYLYIVWCTHTQMCTFTTSEIWATVVDRTTLTTVVGWPQLLGAGLRPTVACDPRNNRSSPSPAFEAAWINIVPTCIIERRTCTAGLLGMVFTLPSTYINPVTGSTVFFSCALRARVLVSSAPGAATTVAVYAIVDLDGSGNNSLVFYRPATAMATAAAYVDGMLVTTHPTPLPNVPGAGTVVDKFITACTNPYDYTDSHDCTTCTLPDQFHCLYQFHVTSSGANPLLIVEGHDNAALFPAGTTETRLVLNQDGSGDLLDDPVSYCAAVNQMGIHVHWRIGSPGTGTHYYARDMNRTFDEDIEENTLVTDQCTISDGTSHGGTVGARILPNEEMAIWTDPNYGAVPSDLTGNSGLYQPNSMNTGTAYVGQISFVGDNIQLSVGNDDVPVGLFPPNGRLTDMPYFYFIFHGSGQGVSLYHDARWDYYGLVAIHNSDGSIHTLGSPFIGGYPYYPGGIIALKGYLYPPGHSSIWDGPDLDVHGGADFTTQTGSELYSHLAGIEIGWDPNIFPLTTYSANASVTGHMTLAGTTDITAGSSVGALGSGPANDILAYIPADSSHVVITVMHGDEVDPQFHSDHTWWWNEYPAGAAEIQSITDRKSPWPVEFLHDRFDAIKFHAINAQNERDHGSGNITIDHCTFNDIHGRCIFLENTLAPTGLDEMYYNGQYNITYNTFGTINATLDADDASHGTYGIYIKGFDGNFDGLTPDLAGMIEVNGNTFTTNNWSTVNPNYSSVGNLEFAAAICFENTTGNIKTNTISDPAYTKGIWLKATLWSGTYPTSRTLVCSNTISNLHPPDQGNTYEHPMYGILTEYHTGYSKLNTITNNEIGYSANGHGRSIMIYNAIDNTHGSVTYDISHAIEVTAPSEGNILDLSGVHTGGNDVEGYNTAVGTYGDQPYGWITGLVTVGTNATFNLGSTIWTTLCPTCTHFGQNNLLLLTSPTGVQPTGTYADIIKGPTGSPSALGDIDFNFWGLDGSSNKIDPANGSAPGSDPENWNAALGSSQLNSVNITYTVPSHTLSAASTFHDIVCGSSNAIANPGKGAKPQSIQGGDSCQGFFNIGSGLYFENEFKASLDTLKYFVEHCPTHAFNNYAIGDISDDVQMGAWGPQPQGSIDERAWLLSAIQLNPHDHTFFCAIVEQIGGTFGSYDTSWVHNNEATNKGLAVLQWLIHNPLCTNGSDSEGYINSRGSQRETWFNTQDTNKVKLDTTLPSMHDLGLDTVLKYAAMLGVHDENVASIISNAIASPNPLDEGTTITFGMSKEAFVKIEVFDLLGNVVASGFESVLEPGNHSVPISLHNLPSGTYYARIMTTYGEVQTVKLAKE